MDLQPQLTAFFYRLEEHKDQADAPEFKLKPLTQAHLDELETTFESVETAEGETRRPSNRTFYRAGIIGLRGGREIRGLTMNGKPVRVSDPAQLAQIPRNWVIEMGAKLCVDAWGLDAEGAEKN